MNLTSPTVSIVIVTWNSAEHIPRCLTSLHNQTFQDFEVIVVDNGSTDDTLEIVNAHHANLDMTLEKTGINHGFAVANNIGARLSRGKWLLLLNADAFPEPDWLEKLLWASENRPECSCFSSRQIQANNPNYLDGAGDVYHVSGLAWRRYIGYPSKDYGNESMMIFSPCAAAAMYLRSAFWDVGGFDEDFFSYFEDVDLGFRLQLMGYRCLYVPEAIVHHVGSSTFGERSDFAFYHTHRNMIWTFMKDMPSALLWRYLPAHLAANFLYLFYYTIRGRGKVLWSAKRDAIMGLRKFVRKRRETQRNIFVTTSALKQVMESGWLAPYTLEYFRRKAIRNLSISA